MKIAHAFHNSAGFTFWVDTTGSSWAHPNIRADGYAAESGKRIIRNPDWSCTIEDLPQPKTALQIIDEVIGYYTACPPKWMGELRDAIVEGRAS